MQSEVFPCCDPHLGRAIFHMNNEPSQPADFPPHDQEMSVLIDSLGVNFKILTQIERRPPLSTHSSV